ncbi:hypothetical protein I79_018436 [Cricetulus griseus]|uniref:Uncharacterized protein n=1 Tax=Cricetulus griseus TaxID=10029 RepID=G3I4Q3_CRIGR|nr:hypothetical protein I79_018436 [Cricetulus griseus]
MVLHTPSPSRRWKDPVRKTERKFKKSRNETLRAMVAHAFNPSTQEVKAGRSLEFQGSLGYTEKPCFEKQKNK